MAKNKKTQSGAVWLIGTAFKAMFLIMVIAGSAVGYVWQKGEIVRLGQQIHQRESLLSQLSRNNQRMADEIAVLHSPVEIDEQVRSMNLGLAPAQPGQVVRLPEPSADLLPVAAAGQRLAERSDNVMTP